MNPMYVNMICLCIGATSAGILLSKLLYLGCSSRKRLREEKLSDEQEIPGYMNPDLWNTVLTFPDYFPERYGSTTRLLISYLLKAKKTVDVCIFICNFKMIRDALIEISKNGVEVRLLTNEPTRFDFPRFGIRARHKHHTVRSPHCDAFIDLMHHKFVIIDKAAVINGSLNWTKSGITENSENVVITTNKQIVDKFMREFLRLWKESRPRNIPQERQQHEHMKPL